MAISLCAEQTGIELRVGNGNGNGNYGIAIYSRFRLRLNIRRVYEKCFVTFKYCLIYTETISPIL